MARKKNPAAEPPEVNFSDDGEVRHLHLGTPWIQGSMRVDAPFDIELEYVQRMMAWLLFVEPASVAGRHAMQLGLGAGALTKFCHKKLRMRTTVVELHPQVLALCRGWFKLPPEDARLSVVLGDAAAEVRRPAWQGGIDALQVDLYDHEAAAPVLDDAGFYADCRALLTDEGCMTVNLFGRASSYARSVEKIAAAFGADALWAFKPTREGNTVVLAQRTPSAPKRTVLAARAEAIQARWGLPAAKWMRVFRPVAREPVSGLLGPPRGPGRVESPLP
ncbi:spermidine synthase [Ramlibacter sp. H39-3-26]|uniref:spermidine synthase n=1 Tax=Curvibacter soli TaxID=3031331 RepID=UPI0023DC29F1|nr:spermidine synthase [Ramlibacter sp. H39-3-26]MDF1483623.1 spermidine synthase [Ramlibacter sp. H39-3-26]